MTTEQPMCKNHPDRKASWSVFDTAAAPAMTRATVAPRIAYSLCPECQAKESPICLVPAHAALEARLALVTQDAAALAAALGDALDELDALGLPIGLEDMRDALANHEALNPTASVPASE